MKTKLNILCFLLLIAFAGCMYNAFLGGMEGASDASRGDIGNKLQPLFYVNVVPTEGNELNDSIPSVIEKGNFLKYHITSIKIEQENTPKDALIQLVMGITDQLLMMATNRATSERYASVSFIFRLLITIPCSIRSSI